MSDHANRIELRQLTIDDREFVFQLYNTEGFLQFVGDRNLRTVDDAEAYLISTLIPMYKNEGENGNEGGYEGEHKVSGMGLHGIYHIEKGIYIGVCGLVQRDFLDAPDLGFGLLPEYEGFGYAREASELVLQKVFDAHVFTLLYAICMERNHRSITLLEKLGFTYLETILKDHERVNKYKLELS